MREIEHNPNERRFGNGVWWFLWVAVPTLWIGYIYFSEPDWMSVAMGAFTAAVFVSWAVDITGNKTPDSWRR